MNNGHEHIDFDLLSKYLAGECTDAEKAEVQAWLEQSEENRAELERLEKVLDLTNSAKSSVEVDEDAAWAKLQNRMQESKQPKLVPIGGKGNNNVLRWGLIAAVFVGIILVGRFVTQNFMKQVEMVQFASNTTTKTDTLPDGSIVTLNKNSSISYPDQFDKKERRIALSGEAFFDVTKDASRPFIIDAGEAEVQVLGTSFNVNAYEANDAITVIVETGKVQVSDKAEQKIILNPYDKGVLNKTNKTLEKTVNEDVLYQNWNQHKLVFNNTPLGEVLEVLNQQYQAQLDLELEQSANCKLTATFNEDSLSPILKVLTSTFNLELANDSTGQVLKGNACAL